MFLKSAVLFLCIAYAACSEYVNAADCVNTTTIYSRDVTMKVSGCTSEDVRCLLIRGTEHSVTFQLVPTKDFTSKTDGRVHGVFEKFSVPYGKKSDACAIATAEDGTSCPDKGGFLTDVVYTHHSQFSVSRNYPTLQLKVRFSFYDRRTKEFLMCKELPVEIIKNPSENES